MKKENLSLVILIVASILLLLNIVTSDKFDLGFWLRIIGNTFIIFAMINKIKEKNSKK